MCVFQQPGEECEEIRAGTSLAPTGNGQSLVKKEKQVFKTFQMGNPGTSLVARWLRLQAAKAGDGGSFPGQGTSSHMPKLRVNMPQLRPAAAK